tara:strand:- start:7709 stop:8092 length:384 start_codon:yes stop_codon:yes gene_type:complete
VRPDQLIGLPYRLGSDPIKHGSADCLSLCRVVLAYDGYIVPTGEREWYRRLRKKDYSVFEDELNRWGIESPPRLGSIALCLGNDNSLALAAYYLNGWLSFKKTFGELAVSWSPLNGLMVKGCYFQRK